MARSARFSIDLTIATTVDRSQTSTISGMSVTRAELATLAADDLTVSISCATCGDVARYCPDLRPVIG